MSFETRRRRLGAIAPPPMTTVHVGDGEAFVVPARLTCDEAERRARERIQEGLTRPADSHRADIEGAQLVWVPLWRVDVSAEGFHVGLSRGTDTKGRLLWVLPTGASKHTDMVAVINARKMLPFDPSPRIELTLDAMVSRSSHAITEGEVLAPDMTRDEAIAEAESRARRAVTSPRALHNETKVRIRSVTLCHYPLWLRRYRYEGEAARGALEECHVALSAVTGVVLSERHPSAWRALAGRVRRLFTRA